jgi:hypothetical protein
MNSNNSSFRIRHKFIWLQCVNPQLANEISEVTKEISGLISHVYLKSFADNGGRAV